MPGLLGMHRKIGGLAAVAVLHLAAPAAALGEIGVAQDGEEPRAQVGAFLEAVHAVPGLEQRLLHQVVGALDVAAQGDGERAQVRHQPQHRLLQRGRRFSHRHFSFRSSAASSSTKRRGTGSAATSAKISREQTPDLDLDRAVQHAAGPIRNRESGWRCLHVQRRLPDAVRTRDAVRTVDDAQQRLARTRRGSFPLQRRFSLATSLGRRTWLELDRAVVCHHAFFPRNASLPRSIACDHKRRTAQEVPAGTELPAPAFHFEAIGGRSRPRQGGGSMSIAESISADLPYPEAVCAVGDRQPEERRCLRRHRRSRRSWPMPALFDASLPPRAALYKAFLRIFNSVTFDGHRPTLRQSAALLAARRNLRGARPEGQAGLPARRRRGVRAARCGAHHGRERGRAARPDRRGRPRTSPGKWQPRSSSSRTSR